MSRSAAKALPRQSQAPRGQSARGSRAYAPPLKHGPGRGYFEREEERERRRSPVLLVGFVVVAAFSGLVWTQYAGATIPRIEAKPGPYKVPPPAGGELTADALEENALYDALEGRAAASPAAMAMSRPAPEEPLLLHAEESPSETSANAPVRFAENGAFVAQVAALQSEAAIAPAWQRLASAAPSLFAHAERDVERADLGQRGTYYRVRAGYFFDRENAARFCERVKSLGQDCVVAIR
ncbi:MAG: SPOR domain-containing protein [Hyphomonadaceae bacterium]|nr:SPOR domain-containing protein [Hyphomonadaceae bacterium]